MPPTSPGDLSAGAPSSPPAPVCGNASALSGPAVPPPGAVVVAQGDDSTVNWNRPGATFWFEGGTHTLGPSGFSQIVPATGAIFVGAPGAVIDGQGINYSAFTTKVTGVTVEFLTIQHFNSPGDQGVVNHDSGDGWSIRHNTITANHGAATMIGSGNTVAYNCLSNNGQYGFNAYSLSGGPRGVVMDHNEITGNNTDDLEAKQPGCGCTGGGKFWQTVDATVTNNYVHDNRGVGLWADGDNVGFDAEGNYISGNDAEGLVYEVSYNALIRDNTFVRNNLVKGPRIDGFPGGALYVSESGGDPRVASPRGYATVDISANVFTDNWDGVVLWENADRFCGNGEAKFCTLVNPSVANLGTCVAGRIEQAPLYSDCRWKTQNVMVHDNTFTITKAHITGCGSARTCGDQGLFSNFGTYPAFSPYRAAIIQDAIAFSQNNRFFNNTYNGEWHFVAHSRDTVLDFRTWQSGRYHQDVGSTIH